MMNMNTKFLKKNILSDRLWIINNIIVSNHSSLSNLLTRQKGGVLSLSWVSLL
jgi:hypothetical protein